MEITESNIHIPQHEIDALARCLLPEIQKFFESPEGKREFEEWQKSRKESTDNTVTK